MRAAERDAAGLRRHQHLGHVRVSGPIARSPARRRAGSCAVTLIAPRQRPCQLFVAEPDVGQPVVVGGLQDVFGVRQLRVAHRLQHRDAHTGVDQQLFGGVVGIAARDPTAGRGGVDAQRVRLVGVRRVVEVRGRRDRVSTRPQPALPLRRRVGPQHFARHRQRVHVGIDDRHGDVLGDVLGCPLDCRHARLPSFSAATP